MPPDHASEPRFGDVRWVEKTGSTNADLLAMARDGAPEGVVLVADHQTAGRGRRDRTWVAPPGSALLVSVLFRPPAALVGATSMAVALAMARAVEQVAGCRAMLKWPNDLVLEDRKLAGILAEADWPAGVSESSGWRQPGPSERVALVVGCGVNLSAPADLAELSDIAETAIWLSQASATAVSRETLLTAFLAHLDQLYREMLQLGSAGDVMRAWRERSATFGQRVRVDLGHEDVVGTAVDVTDEGHLIVETLEGERRILAVGDVVHLR